MNKLFFLCFLNVFLITAQDINTQALHYEVIRNVISQDTVVQDWQKKIIRSKLKSGQMESSDSLAFINKIKYGNLVLNSKSLNGVFADFPDKIKKGKGHIQEWIGSDIDNDFRNKLSAKFEFTESPYLEGIEIVNGTGIGKGHHRFSSSIEVGKNTFLIYWQKYSSGMNSSHQLIKNYKDSNGSLVLDYYLLGKS